MKKRIAIKIIGSVIIFSFAILFLGTIFPLQALGATNTGLNWENPNANGNNPYKFKPQDVLNSQLIMQVVGCTGVVDKVSAAIVGFVQGKAGKIAAEAIRKETNKQIEAAARKACETGKKTSVSAVASIPQVSVVEIPKLIPCEEIINTNDAATVDALIEQKKADAASKTREECFNGIAITLAKNQLTAMTRYTMNWVNSGFSGDPMYVREITTLTNKIERDSIQKGILELTKTDKGYPYATSFSTAIVNRYKSVGALENGAGNFLANMTSTMGSFVTDPESYKYTSTGKVDNRTAVQKAKDANKSFANNFSAGGWDGWLALTSEQNNPLGFSMSVSQYLTDQAEQEKDKTKFEISTNNGFLSQKKCSLYNDVDKELLVSKLSWLQSEATNACKDAVEVADCLDATDLVKQTQYQIDNFVRSCVTWDVVTPGTLIKDKVSTYVNSPERQLELADTINDALNSLFTVLITKFQNNGLSSLSSEKYVYTSSDMGSGPGASNIDLFSSTSTGGYINGSFDLTRDLGNRFIHGYKLDPIGEWNAQTNITTDKKSLSVGVAPLMPDGTQWEPNVFYVVKNGVTASGKGIVGKTKLFENGNNNWENGDRAFWNGTDWQNWKKAVGNLNPSPIAKRGVIQIQKDYVVAAKEILSALPSIMPKMGELDYCIPGPNPNWKGISSDTSALFADYASSVTAEYKKGSLFKRKTNTYSIAKIGEPQYDDYYNVFKLTAYPWWSGITTSSYWNRLLGYGNMGTVKGSAKNLGKVQQNVDDFLEKINTDSKIFYDMYTNYIDSLYGAKSLMQTQYFQREDTAELTQNNAYLPMATEGLNITKDITSYNDDIINTAEEYRNAIIQANTNVSRLSAIKDKVTTIIVAAQKRRDAKILAELEKEAAASKGPVLTYPQYREKYKACLAEEEIVFYDDLTIIGAPDDEKNRCNDNLDNDLDGLVDDLDPDCPNNQGATRGTSYVCTNDLTQIPMVDNDGNPIRDENGNPDYYPPFQDDTGLDPIPNDTKACAQRSAGECTSTLYYSGGIGFKCKPASN